MNTIAMHIDHATDALKALNDLMDAQKHFDSVYYGSDTQAVIDAHMRLRRAKDKHAELSGPADYVAHEYAPSELNDCGETFPRVKRERINPDDPRRGQAADINRANRGNV